MAANATITKSSLRVSKGALLVLWIGGMCLVQLTGLDSASDALIVVTTILFGLLMARGSIHKDVAKVALAFFALTSIYVFLTVVTPSFNGMKHSLGMGVSTVVFLYCYHYARGTRLRRDIAWTALALAPIVVVVGIASGAVLKNGYSAQAGYFILIFGTMAIERSRRPHRVALLTFGTISALAAALDHRTFVGLGILGYFVFLSFWLSGSKFVRNLSFVIMLGMIILTIALFANLFGFNIRNWNNLSVEFTGRVATSGRQFIWPLILANVAERPWLGLGTGAIFGDLATNTTLSAHSLWLQILMQTGIVGLTSLCAVLFLIWRMVRMTPGYSAHSALVATSVLFVIIHSSFEVFLVENQLVLGILTWMTLGLGIGTNNRLSKQREQEPSVGTQQSD